MTKEEIMEKIKLNNIKEALGTYKNKAIEVIRNADKFEQLMIEFEQKCQKLPQINIPGIGTKIDTSKIIGDFFTLASLARSYIINDYRDISLSSVIMIVSGLLYFVAPIDLIPDFIPITGWIDDIATIVFILNTLDSELEKYKKWRDHRDIINEEAN